MTEPVKKDCRTCRWLSDDAECRYDAPVVTSHGTQWPLPFSGLNRNPWCRHHDTGQVTPAPVRVASGPLTLKGG